MIRLGLIGCGAWGKNYIETIKSIPDAELVAVCDKNRPTFDYHQLTNIDKVIIATPPSTHCEITTYFLKNRIPVLLEKPVAETLTDAEAIFNTAQNYGTTILIDNTHLFAPAYLGLRDFVNPKDQLEIRTVGVNHGPFREYSSLLDYGPHNLSMCLGLVEKYPDRIKCRRDKKDLGEIYTLELDFGSAHAVVEVGNGHTRKERTLVAITPHHHLIYDGSLQSLKINSAFAPVSISPPLTEVVRSFVGTETDWRYSPELNLNVMKILTEVLKTPST